MLRQKDVPFVCFRRRDPQGTWFYSVSCYSHLESFSSPMLAVHRAILKPRMSARWNALCVGERLTVAEYGQTHSIRWIMILVEIEKYLSNVDSALFRRRAQRFGISNREPRIRMFGIGGGFLQLRNAPRIFEDIALVFGIDCFKLSICRRGSEQGWNEELSKAEEATVSPIEFSRAAELNLHVECFRQLAGIDIEVVIGMITTGECIGIATISLDQFRILIFARILEQRRDFLCEDNDLPFTLLLPINSICSRKCAMPGASFGSARLPILTSSAAAALSTFGWLIRTTNISLASSSPR